MRLIHGFSRAGRRALGLFLVLLSVSAPLAAQSDPNFAIVTSGHTGSGTLVNDERGIPVKLARGYPRFCVNGLWFNAVAYGHGTEW